MLKTKKKSNKSYEDIHYSCTIRYLDDSEPLTVTYQKDSKGQWLLDHVCKELNLVEKDYFGLRFVDPDKQRHWLDPTKTVHRQMKNVNPTVLCFRVKFYPQDPLKLKEEITRYLIFLQLRRDLHHGRLLCSPTDANEMAGYIIQSEVGDYDPQDHAPGYVAQFKMLPKQTQKQEEKIAEFHKKVRGQVPSEAEGNFLKKSCTLETYGVDPHPVKSLSDYDLHLSAYLCQPKLGAVIYSANRDQKGNQMYLGVTHLGIVTFQGNKRTHLFKWPQITKIAFEGKMFIVHVIISEKKHACGFKCATFSACKHLWKCAVEQQYFFTLNSSTEAKKVTSGGSFFTRGSKFRFSGRCQREVYTDSASITRDEPSFVRTSSNPAFVRSFNNSRSASLPNRLKDRSANSDILDVTLDNNHVTTLDSVLAVSTPLEDHIEDTIPEESVLELGDSPYRPMSSPTSEELPPFPGTDSSLGASPICADKSRASTLPRFQKPGQEVSDLDVQIQELQKELEQCRKSAEGGSTVTGAEIHSGAVLFAEAEANHTNYSEVPVDVDRTEKVAVTPLNVSSSNNHSQAGNSKPTPTPEAIKTPNGGQNSPITPAKPPDKKSRSVVKSVVKAVVATMFVTLALALLLALFVLETDLQIPVVKDIRKMPEIQDFKTYHYDPAKAKMGSLFGR